MEIDFVAKTQSTVHYLQVAESVHDAATRERELKPFSRLKDSYPCILVTLDTTPNADYNGVRHLNALEFFKGKRYSRSHAKRPILYSCVFAPAP